MNTPNLNILRKLQVTRRTTLAREEVIHKRALSSTPCDHPGCIGMVIFTAVNIKCRMTNKQHVISISGTAGLASCLMS